MTTSPVRRSRPRRSAVLGAGLGVAMGLSNALGFLFVLVLSRPLGPADFGGFSALSTYGVLLAIPAGAFQVVLARRYSRPGQATSGLSLAVGLGVGLSALTAVLAPWLSVIFHLDSAWSVVWLGLTLIPMMLTGCAQGLLLGADRLGSLSLLYLVTATTRLAAALAAAWLQWSVATVFAALLVGAGFTALCGLWWCRDLLGGIPPRAAGLARELTGSQIALSAFMVLTNSDVVLARHFLTPYDSGGYALASTFGRAICWVTQFVALLIVPRMSAKNARRRLNQASAFVLAAGLVALATTAAAPRLWITIAGGSAYADYGTIVLASVAVGTLWALAQLWLFSELADGQQWLGRLTWVVIAAQTAVIVLWRHDSPVQILSVCALGALAVVGCALARGRRRPHARPAHLKA